MENQDNNTVHVAQPLEKTSNKTTVITTIVAIILALLLTLIILFYTGLINERYFAFLPFVGDEETQEEQVSDEEFIAQITGTGNSAKGNEDVLNYMTVKLAMLASDSYDIEGKKRGCDTVYMIDRQIERTQTPLNAAISALFNNDHLTDFYIGNYVGVNNPNLKFDRAVIENRIAKVYLSGEVGDVTEGCEDRLKIQLEETALQFGSVDSVEVYLNGELY